MALESGTFDISLLYTIDTITANDFGGSGADNTLTLSNLTQVDATAYDDQAVVDDSNNDSTINAYETLTLTSTGGTETVLTRLNTVAEYGRSASGFGSGTDSFAIFEDSSGQQYILFSEDFDLSRIANDGTLVLEEQADAAGNLEVSDILCFAKGTMILTVLGERSVEGLKTGDRLVTRNGQLTTIRWTSHTHHSAEALSQNPNFRPYKIAKNTFADGVPHRDLLVTKQHRVLLNSIVAKRMTGQSEVLVPTHILSDRGYSSQQTPQDGISYYHILTDRHDVIWANGLPSETLYIGSQLIKIIGPKRYQEVCQLLETGTVSASSAHHIMPNKKARKLIERIAANKKSLFEGQTIPVTVPASTGSMAPSEAVPTVPAAQPAKIILFNPTRKSDHPPAPPQAPV